MAIVLDRITKLVLATGVSDVTIQDLYNAITDFQDEPGNLDLKQIARASGKQSLRAGLTVGITLEMLDGWRITFDPAAVTSPQVFVLKRIISGNLAESSPGVLPILGQANINIVIVQDTSAAGIATGSGLDSGQDARLTLIEKLLRNRLETNPTTGVMTLFDDDDSVLLTTPISEDVGEAQPYQGKGLDRRNRLT